MSCAEQRQKRWRKAPHGGSAFSALGNTALISRLSFFSFPSLLIYPCVSLLTHYLYILNSNAEISCSRIFLSVSSLYYIYTYIHPISSFSFILPFFISLSTFLTPFKGGRSAAERIQTDTKYWEVLYITAPNRAWYTTHERNFLRWHVLRATRSRRVAPRILPIGALRNGRSEACNGGFIS